MKTFSLWSTLKILAITIRRKPAAAAKSLQACPTLCDPLDGSPPGSPVPGILQARTLEWVAIAFSNAWKWKVKVKSLSRVQLLVTSWTAAHQAPPSMGFSRQEYWSGVPSPRRKPMVPNKLKYTFRFKFYISIKTVPKTKLLDGKATRTTAFDKKGHSSETLCFKEKWKWR